MAEDPPILSENVALLDGDPREPFWAGRLSGESDVAALGETFILNGLVSPTPVSVSALVSDEAAEAVGRWLATLIVDFSDDLYRKPGETATDGEQPVMSAGDLASRVLVGLDQLPAAYADWRLTTEIYALDGRSLYRLAGELAVRHKRLSDTELGMAYSKRMLPFLPDAGEEPSGVMIFVVGVPGRGASLGGLRGYRRGLLDAGQALGALKALSASGEGRWLWTTEFYDDACGRVLSVDGLERVPLGIGVHLLAKEVD